MIFKNSDRRFSSISSASLRATCERIKTPGTSKVPGVFVFRQQAAIRLPFFMLDNIDKND